MIAAAGAAGAAQARRRRPSLTTAASFSLLTLSLSLSLPFEPSCSSPSVPPAADWTGGLDADRSQALARKVGMTASTLVETVSINYEDFTEGFLTCSTCLCTYDASDHYPKLLHCSHTVCRTCLEKISTLPGVRELGHFRCPICREQIALPRGGVCNLPPSFLVNQLLDLMARQRREVIPKCSSHTQQELLFCETCDVVFCNVCTSGAHSNIRNSQGLEHTVITFSIAIKRMSEILVYKGHQCIAKLDEAHDNVQNEMRKLDQNADHAFEDINRTFQEIINMVDRRRQELLSLAKKIREDKHCVLEDQLKLIEAEKEKVDREISSLQYHGVEVKNITKKINDLGEKIDSVSSLLDPRENCFIRYEHMSPAVNTIQACVNDFGAIRTSKTFPSLSTASVGKCSAHLRAVVTVTAVDYNGHKQRFGGDPVSAELRHEDGTNVTVRVVDNRDGSYEAQFVPPKGGSFTLRICIFGRPIKTYPLIFDATDHINPLCIYGCRGPDTHQFNQPVGLAVNSKDGHVYILDNGNGRIKVLAQNDTNNSPFSFVCHIEGHDMENRSATGIALNTDSESLLISNWRTKKITEIDLKGNFIRHFGHSDFVEPTYLAVNSRGEILVADNGARCVFIFHPSGKLKCKIPGKSDAAARPGPGFGVIGALSVGPEDEIMIADSTIHIFSSAGERLRQVFPQGKDRGQFCGVSADAAGHLVATRVEKVKSFIQVFDYVSGHLKFVINSSEAKLKRPTSIATTNEFHAIVVDLGNDCIKKYRYH